ncbi:MAG: hypothetical protein EXQ53_11515 [Acidobacteria bacterium]|nr:hypothetical protein [Acidobacteriota bacterium]
MGHEGRRDGPQQQEAPVPAAVGIDRAAQSWKQIRPGLRFVEDDQAPALDEPVPLDIEAQPVGGLLQVEVR